MATASIRVSPSLIAELLHLPRSVRCVDASVSESTGEVVLDLDGLPGLAAHCDGGIHALQHIKPVRGAKGEAEPGVWSRSCWLATAGGVELTERREWIEADVEDVARAMRDRGTRPMDGRGA